MHSILLSLAAVVMLQGYAAAQTPGTLHFDIARSNAPLLRKRDGTVASDLDNDLAQGLYLINVTIGNPPQTVGLHLDTGSSDTWVVSSNNTVCDGGQCVLGNCKSSSHAQK